jgi:glycosidase
MTLEGATLEGAMLHVAFMLSVRGIPQLYAGEEILMEGGDDPFNRNDFPGGWSNDKRNAFTKEGRTANEQKMFEWTQRWIRLRRLLNQGLIHQSLHHEEAMSQTTKMTDIFYDNDSYLFKRGTFIVAFNNSSAKKKVSFPSVTVGLNGTVRVSSFMRNGIAFKAKNGRVEIELEPKSAEVFNVVHVLK